jgi:hypothetical protein
MRRSLFIAFVAGVVGGCYLRPAPRPWLPLRLRRRRRLPGPRLRRQGDLAGRRCRADRGLRLRGGPGQPRSRRRLPPELPRRSLRIPLRAPHLPARLPHHRGLRLLLQRRLRQPLRHRRLQQVQGLRVQRRLLHGAADLHPPRPGWHRPRPARQQLGGGNSSNLAEGAGVCGQRCDAKDAPPCPGGQYCTGALCLPGCDNPEATPCGDGKVCIALAGYSSCLVTCDVNDADSCGTGEVCVPGFNVCQPTCLGDGAIECSDGFICDAGPQDLRAHQHRQRRRLLERHHLRDGP